MALTGLLALLACSCPTQLLADSVRHSQSYSVSNMDRMLSAGSPRSLSRSYSRGSSLSTGPYGVNVRNNSQLMNASRIPHRSNVLSGGGGFVGSQGHSRRMDFNPRRSRNITSSRSTLSNSRSTLIRSTSTLSRSRGYSGTRAALR